MHKITVLDNGLRVITQEMPTMESVTVGVWIGVGGRYEETQLNGVSHFLEHLLFKGTNKRTAKQISREIESGGGMLNGFTGEEYTCYMAKVLPRHLRRACDVLFDMYFNASLNSGDIERERGVIREEINMYRDMPQAHVGELLNLLMWKDHPLGNPLAGTPETVAAMTPAHIRAFMKRHYTSSNTVVAAAGNVRHEALLSILHALLPGTRHRATPTFLPVRARQRKPHFVLERKQTEQTHFDMGIRAYPREHMDRYALHLLSVVLGENMSSRLFQQIREKRGLAYAIHSSVVRYHDTGALVIYAGVENGKFLDALHMILMELVKVRSNGIRKGELSRARDYCTGQLSMAWEKTTQNMMRLGENLLCEGRVLTKEEILANLRKVAVEDIQRVATDLFIDRKLNLAAIGPLPVGDREIAETLHL